MERETQETQEIDPSSPSGNPEPPLLSSELNSLYQSLDSFNRGVFVKVFRYLWGVVAPASRFVKYGGVLYSYYVVDLLRLRLDLSPAELSVASFLYGVTHKGRDIIHSSRVNDCHTLDYMTQPGRNYVLRKLKRSGYITRATRNPADPYYSRSRSVHPVFIGLSSKGVRLIEDMEKDLYKILVNNCLDDLKGNAKKPKRTNARAKE